jgi:nucleoside-diphosphate-sugar epimerase
MNRVLLTGATGFIGSHVAELFSKENIPIKCMVRPTADLSFLNHLNVETCVGDITDYEPLEEAMQDIDFVIHTAGKSSDWGKHSDFYNSNVIGTLNILKACKSKSISNIIITGSISSYGEENSKQIKNEDSPFNSHYPYFLDRIFPSAMNHYRDTKAILTKEAVKFAEENSLNLTVLEPAWVYGEREFNTGFFEYLKSVQNGMKLAPGSKFNKLHVIYAADLSEAYLTAFRKKLTGINRIIIGNPTADKLNEIHSLFCESAKLKPPKLLPKFILFPIGFWMELLSTIFQKKNPPLLTRSRVNMMYDSFEFSTEKAKRILGFVAGTSLKDGVFQTVKWYKDNGYLEEK